jgi:hypothetical protein
MKLDRPPVLGLVLILDTFTMNYSAWIHGAVNDLRKPLSRDEYRNLGTCTVLGVLFGATIGFIVIGR